MADPTSSPFPSSSTAAAGEAGNDDVKQGDDAVDDGFEDGTNSIDDGHDASTDGLEDRLDLCDKQMSVDESKSECWGLTPLIEHRHARRAEG